MGYQIFYILQGSQGLLFNTNAFQTLLTTNSGCARYIYETMILFPYSLGTFELRGSLLRKSRIFFSQ